jgi:hypothetical protein
MRRGGSPQIPEVFGPKNCPQIRLTAEKCPTATSAGRFDYDFRRERTIAPAPSMHANRMLMAM